MKLAKRVKYAISSRADIGDGTEEMDLATGIFAEAAREEEERDIQARSVEDDAVDGEADAELEDEVAGEFQAPNVPNDDINLLLALGTTATTPFIGPVAPTTVPTAPTDAASTGTAMAPANPTTPIRTSRGSTSARHLVSPYERRGSNKNNPQHEGLMQMMQMSMLQHNQFMEEERKRRGEEREDRLAEREDRLAMQQMLATAVGGAVAYMKKF